MKTTKEDQSRVGEQTVIPPERATASGNQLEINSHVAVEDGSYELAIRNIVCHLDTLLTDEQKAAINWHPEQSVSLAVMRLIAIDDYRGAGLSDACQNGGCHLLND